MENKSGDRNQSIARSMDRGCLTTLLGLAAMTLIVHLFTGGRYGFHRDELATLDDAKHLAWGYVAYPPVTPFFARLSLELFGTSLTGFRFFAALADAMAVVFAGLITRELGGGRAAQLLTALAVTPFCLGAGTLMQYVSFDYLFWLLTAYCVARLLSSGDPRWWIGVGCSIGFGMLTKYSMLVCLAGVVVAVIFTNPRGHLKTKWLWIGVGCSVLIFLPNFLWQLRHDFVSVDFLRQIHARDVRIGRTRTFLSDQLLLTLFSLPLVIAGLYFYFFSDNSHRLRALGWMYVVPFALFFILRGRGYYLEPAYPVIFAGGSVWAEDCLAKMRRLWARPIWAALWAAMAVNILLTAAFMLPLAPINSRWWRIALKINGDFAEEIGWPELAETVAHIRDSRLAEERSQIAILAGNYGEAGAINLYGSLFGLPMAISGVNSFWDRGYGDPPPQTLIVLGYSRTFLEQHFESCELAGRVRNAYGVANEETRDHPEIFVCRRLRESWPEFWRTVRHYG
jgi:4-amino-4-deoxy-L-arabinose transferase-like glycosyltransferase